MGSTKLEWTVAAFILMGLACALALAFASTDAKGRLQGVSYDVTASFANAGELKVRAPVKIAGVKVGEVSGIRLDPVSFDAVVTLRLAQSAGEIPADTSASIYTAGLLGERYVGLTPGGDPEPLKSGDQIYLTQSAVVLEQLIGKFMFGSAEGGDEAGPTQDPYGEPSPQE